MDLYITSLCYVERDGKYLMLHRVKKEEDRNRDKWIGIGGSFLEDESPEDCVRREAREETGLTLVTPVLRAVTAPDAGVMPDIVAGIERA